MRLHILRIVIVMALLALVSCASSTNTKEAKVVVDEAKVVTRSLMANGYAKRRQLPELTLVQNQFAMEQSAKLNAYRELAKQLYKEPLVDNVLVADQVIKNELYRIYVDLYLREAVVIKSSNIADLQKIVLNLNLTPRFYRCASSTVKIVSQCLREDNKVAFTRIGYQIADKSTVDMSCASLSCTPQMSVSGFSSKPKPMDNAMLNAGLYDAGWSANMAFKSMLRYLVLTGIVFN